jgi:hypothetical protein
MLNQFFKRQPCTKAGRLLFLLALLSFLPPLPASAAENLRLREGLSYVHDVDKGFPIIADKFDDVKIEPGRPALVFFGAAGDLNTNRQARRVVDLYKKFKDSSLKFIIVDVDHVGSAEGKQLLKNYYQGYIPHQVIVDKQGKMFWFHIGEIDQSSLVNQISKVVN